MDRYYGLTYRERSKRARLARTQHIARCRRIIAVIVGIVIIGVVFCVHILRSSASGIDVTPAYKYYKNIVIAYDYNLSDAAAEYADEHYASENDYLREVCSINHLASASDVTPGTHVVVPYYSAEFK